MASTPAPWRFDAATGQIVAGNVVVGYAAGRANGTENGMMLAAAADMFDALKAIGLALLADEPGGAVSKDSIRRAVNIAAEAVANARGRPSRCPRAVAAGQAAEDARP